MSNLQLIERALASFANPAERPLYFDLYSPDVIFHGYDGVDPGLESVKRFYEGVFAGFPDVAVTVEDALEAGEKVAVRFVLRGTHLGTFNGIPATGKTVAMPGMTILRFDNGKCVERWSTSDFLKLLQQIGAFPAA